MCASTAVLMSRNRHPLSALNTLHAATFVQMLKRKRPSPGQRACEERPSAGRVIEPPLESIRNCTWIVFGMPPGKQNLSNCATLSMRETSRAFLHTLAKLEVLVPLFLLRFVDGKLALSSSSLAVASQFATASCRCVFLHIFCKKGVGNRSVRGPCQTLL